MKFGIGLYLWTTDVTREHLPLFAKVRDAGYDGAEVPVGSQNAPLLDEIRRALDDEGLACSTITNVGVDKDTVSTDALVRRAALDEIKFGIEASRTLGSDILVGPYQAAYGHFSGAGPTDDELSRSAEVLREASEFAQSAGIRLGVEFLNRFEGYLLNTMEQSAALARKVEHPAFGVLYDTHHAHIEESDPVAAIRENAEYIFHVHFSENNRGLRDRGERRHVGREGLRHDPAVVADVAERVDRLLPPDLAGAEHVWRNTFPSKDQFASDANAFLRKIWA